MKKTKMFGGVAFLTVLALGVGAFLASPRVSVAKAYSDVDGYTPTNDHFVAAMHRNNALRDAYDGDDEYAGDSTRKENVTIEGLSATSSITWKVSCAKYSYDTIRNLKLGNKAKTIENHSDPEFEALFTAIGVSSGHRASAFYTTNQFSSITDISMTWGSINGNLHSDGGGDIYFLYKLSDGDWTPILRESKGATVSSMTAFYGTDDTNRKTNGIWNQRIGYFSEATIQNKNPDLVGKSAQLAVVYDAGTSDSASNHICINTLMVNRVASVKAQLHYWDKSGLDSALCEYIADPLANNNHRLGMFAYSLTNDHVTALNVAANFEYERAKEATYYAQLYYLGTLAGYDTLPDIPVASLATKADNSSATNSNIYLAVALVTGTTLVAVTTLLVIKKRKHN